MKFLTQKNKQCPLKKGCIKAGGWREGDGAPKPLPEPRSSLSLHMVTCLQARQPSSPAFSPASLPLLSDAFPVPLQTVKTDGIIHKHDNWKEHSKPILFVADYLRKPKKTRL